MIKEFLVQRNLKKLLKVVHIFLATCAAGGLVSILALMLLKHGSKIQGNFFPIDFSILKLFSMVVNYSFFGILGTAFLYEFFTDWGFLRFKWIIAKWLMVGVLLIITLFGLGPAVNGMASISDAGFSGTVLKAQYSGFENRVTVFTLAELLCLLALMIISTVKPWGKKKEGRFINKKAALCIVLPLVLLGSMTAILQSARLDKYRRMPIGNTALSGVKDGVYEGSAEVGSYNYKVKVYIENNRIIKIEAVDSRESVYAAYAEGVFSKIIKEQNANVDAVSGATTTSKAYMKAVENALSSGK